MNTQLQNYNDGLLYICNLNGQVIKSYLILVSICLVLVAVKLFRLATLAFFVDSAGESAALPFKVLILESDSVNPSCQRKMYVINTETKILQ